MPGVNASAAARRNCRASVRQCGTEGAVGATVILMRCLDQKPEVRAHLAKIALAQVLDLLGDMRDIDIGP